MISLPPAIAYRSQSDGVLAPHTVSSRSDLLPPSFAPEAAQGSNNPPPSLFLLLYFPEHASSYPLTFTVFLASTAFISQTLGAI